MRWPTQMGFFRRYLLGTAILTTSLTLASVAEPLAQTYIFRQPVNSATTLAANPAHASSPLTGTVAAADEFRPNGISRGLDAVRMGLLNALADAGVTAAPGSATLSATNISVGRLTASGEARAASFTVQGVAQPLDAARMAWLNAMYAANPSAAPAPAITAPAPATAAVPTGAVMAFNLAACPTGWAQLANQAGRAVVGVGTLNETYNPGDRASWSVSQTYVLGQTGGFASWRQSVAEMPSHSHALAGTFARYSGSSDIRNGNAVGLDPVTQPATNAVGGGGPMENRMPFVALLLCQKA